MENQDGELRLRNQYYDGRQKTRKDEDEETQTTTKDTKKKTKK